MPKQRLNNVSILLAGDVGATKTNFALFDVQAIVRELSEARTFQNENYASFDNLLKEYLAEIAVVPQALSLGVAGPVNDGQVRFTNRQWTLDSRHLQSNFSFSHVWLLNDLKATAQAVPLLGSEDLQVLKVGQPDPAGSIALIAPGTGLGEAYLTVRDGEYRAHASEGGHSDFAPRNELQDELLQYLRQQYEHVSYEQVCSGIGLPNIYNFLRDAGHAEEPAWLLHLFGQAKDPTAIIVEAALDLEKKSIICQMTLDIFIEILAAETGNLALKVGASGGVYIGGGIPPRILTPLSNGSFERHFVAKGQYRDYLERIPVQVVLNPQTALLGAADYGLRKLQLK